MGFIRRIISSIKSTNNTSSNNVLDYPIANIPNKAIINMIIEEHYSKYADHPMSDITFSPKKLSKLLLLVDLCYMNRYNIRLNDEEYYISSNRDIVPKQIFDIYLSSAGTYILPLQYSSINDKISSQREADELIGKLNKTLKNTVSYIMDITSNLDPVDLVEVFKILPDSRWQYTEPKQEYKGKQSYLNKYEHKYKYVLKDGIYYTYKDFDFNKLKKLNDEEKEKSKGEHYGII